MSIESELKDALSQGKIVIGTKEVMKGLKNNSFKSIIISNNCPEERRKDLKHLADEEKIKIEEFSGSGKQLGVTCGKPFGISVLGIKR